uniref:Uncharacterized protein n=1 Tax=Anguilla anguilla TaxID=7936 RepID=A0A0E9W7P0_ANGAN
MSLVLPAAQGVPFVQWSTVRCVHDGGLRGCYRKASAGREHFVTTHIQCSTQCNCYVNAGMLESYCDSA